MKSLRTRKTPRLPPAAKSKPKSSVSLARVREDIDQEGFDYAFRSYSSYPEIKDAKFHALRKRYILAAKALEAYVGSR